MLTYSYKNLNSWNGEMVYYLVLFIWWDVERSWETLLLLFFIYSAWFNTIWLQRACLNEFTSSYWTNCERSFIKLEYFIRHCFTDSLRGNTIVNEYNFKTVLQKIFFFSSAVQRTLNITLCWRITCKYVRIEKRSGQRNSREIWLLTDIIWAENWVYYIHSGTVCV